MKTGLPVLLALVWAPIVWLSVGSVLSPAFFRLTASHAAAGALSILSTAAVVYLFLRLFGRLSRRIGGGQED
ncbi:hypothetical protein [Chlorobium sp. N1]|uniref:hypothetical protein n=1 Tax=Chlorobium sp. N1 TaxID=2491138 RepID=UPI001040126F|nr:hypothetical protein [Chlorobium sp. N1]TCD47300.1 hypothetical protein E0L29_08380 [Chlorobium sp. N1]